MTNLCNQQANRRVSAAVFPTIVFKNGTNQLGAGLTVLRVLLHNVGFGGRNGHNPINVQ